MKNNNFLGYVHSFRGFAILNIVAIHAVAFAIIIPTNWEPDPTSLLYVLNETLFHDSTLYFALISGLLFSSILRDRGYRPFFWSKVVNVVSPYIFCTIIFSAMRWNMENTGVYTGPESMADYLGSILPNLVRGEAQFTYWYIPVLLIMFALTPLLSWLSRARSIAATPLWVIMLMPLLFSRPEFVPGTLQVNLGTVIYFTGAYTAGIYLGNELETCMDRLAKYRKPLLLLGILSSAAIMTLSFLQINRFGSFSLQETLYYVQKLCFAAVILVWLRNRAAAQPRWLTGFANEAFSIYFLHAFFIVLMTDLLWDFLHDERYQPLTIYLGGPVYFVFALAMSMLVVYLMRRIFGKRSRMLIGS